MDWKTILLLAISALLLVVWLPMLYISIRKVLRHSRPGHAPRRILTIMLTLAALAAGQSAWAAEQIRTVTYTITSAELNTGTNQYDIVFTRSGNEPFDESAPDTYTTYVSASCIGKTSGGSGNFSVELADGFSLRLQWAEGSNVGFTNNCIHPGSGKQITYSVSCKDYYYVTHLTLSGSEGVWRDADIAIRQSWPSSSITSGSSLGSVTVTYTDTPDINILDSDGENAYKIQSKHDLRHLANYVNKGDGVNHCIGLTFLQTQDIACDDSYMPIGSRPSSNQRNSFKGTYDGQGHQINGITVTRTGSDKYADSYIGIFGLAGSGSVIKNVVLAKSTFTGYQNVGGIAGQAEGTVQNCRVERTVTILAGSDKAENFGGIVGNVGGDYSRVIGCVCAATVSFNGKSNSMNFGGIVGYQHKGAIRNCLYTGTSLQASRRSGAIVGYGSGLGSSNNNYFTNIDLHGDGYYSANFGTLRARTVTLGEGVTLVGDETTYNLSGLTAIGTGNYALRYFDGTTTTLYSGNTHKLSLSAPVGYTATYSVNGTAIDGNTFTMPDDDVTVTITSLSVADSWTLTATPATLLGESKYVATFFQSTYDYQLPAGALAYTASLDGGKLVFRRIGENSDIVPKNTAVIIVSDAASITMTRLSSTTVTGRADNILQGSDDPVEVTDGQIGGKTVYVLGKDSSGTLGFYLFSGTSIPAGKAYYVVQ